MVKQYKQFSLETALRNPARNKGILKILSNYENEILSNELILEIMTRFYDEDVLEMQNQHEEFTNMSIVEKNRILKEKNKKRAAHFPFTKGYQARFGGRIRNLIELGMVYLVPGKKIKLAGLTKKYLEEEISTTDFYVIQLLIHNRMNPIRRGVKNDFRYFRFLVRVLLELDKNREGLTYSELLYSFYSIDGDHDRFLVSIRENKEIINQGNNKLNLDSLLYATKNRVDREYNSQNKASMGKRGIYLIHNDQTKMDYANVVINYLFYSGLMSRRYSKRGLIYVINEDNKDFVKTLIDKEYEFNDEEKCRYKSDDNSYEIEKIGKYFARYDEFSLKMLSELETNIEEKDVLWYEKYDKILDRFDFIDEEYLLFKICKVMYNVNCNIKYKRKLTKIEKIQKYNFEAALKNTPDFVDLEFYFSLYFYIKFGDNFKVVGNYISDSEGFPIRHAPGGFKGGDIEIISEDKTWLVEVTKATSRNQQMNFETSNVIRHFNDMKNNFRSRKYYLILIAPKIHTDTRTFYENEIIGLWSRKENHVFIRPYGYQEFQEQIRNEDIFMNIENYTNDVMPN